MTVHAALWETLAAKEEEIQKLGEEAATRKAEIETLTAEAAAQRETLAAKEEEIQKLGEEAETRKAEIETLTAEVKVLDEQMKDLETAAVNAGTQLTETARQSAGKDQEIARLTEETNALQTRVNQLTAENESLQARIYALEGRPIDRYARTNNDKVRLRRSPDTTSYRMRELRRGTTVLVLREVVNSRYETWAEVEVDGQTGFILMEFLDLDE